MTSNHHCRKFARRKQLRRSRAKAKAYHEKEAKRLLKHFKQKAHGGKAFRNGSMIGVAYAFGKMTDKIRESSAAGKMFGLEFKRRVKESDLKETPETS